MSERGLNGLDNGYGYELNDLRHSLECLSIAFLCRGYFSATTRHLT